MSVQMSKEQILGITKSKGEFFVHRYKYSHDGLRKKTKEMAKDGALALKRRCKDGFHYVLPGSAA